MTTPRRRRLPLIALAGSLALAAPLMLSGCSLIHLPGTSSGGGISIPGVGSAGTGKLPSDFPTSDVPVIKGDVVSGLSLGTGKDKAWNVTIKVSGVDAFDEIASELTGAGFKQEQLGGKTSDGATGVFTKGDYNVAILLSKADEKTGFVANYTVTKSSSSSNNG
ncbi:MAG TPA: hypothetical protein VFQ74_08075 [Pseudolysinimonas sp.]|nr:hypothetical protein [Pseudolysinimonas sp.]